MVVSTLGWANNQVILSLGFWNHVSEILVRICSLETEEIKNHEQGGSHIGLCAQRPRANQWAEREGSQQAKKRLFQVTLKPEGQRQRQRWAREESDKERSSSLSNRVQCPVWTLRVPTWKYQWGLRTSVFFFSRLESVFVTCYEKNLVTNEDTLPIHRNDSLRILTWKEKWHIRMYQGSAVYSQI